MPPSAPSPSRAELGPYQPCLEQRGSEGRTNLPQLHREIAGLEGVLFS
jgi:hypothetical protein